MRTAPLIIAFSLCAVRYAHADDKKPACPTAVTSAVAKAYPDGTISSCKHEVEDGHEQFEVKLTRKAGAILELDVLPDGKIVQTEETIELKDVPDAVTKAFAAKYPKAKATKVEREVHADGNTYYELGFVGEKGEQQEEATFSASGKFLEEEAHSAATDEKKAEWRKLRTEREQAIHERGETFARIAVKKDYTGEYVVFRDKDVTAFLDLKDPQHPRYRPGHDEDGVDPKKLAHILVVPNEPRETIGKTVASDVTAEDLEVTLKVMKAAQSVAKKLNIKNAKIYVKSPERVGVGYLHVHIVGERDPSTAYPPALKSQ